MRGAVLPAAMLCMALGLCLGFVSARARIAAVAMLLCVSVPLSFITMPQSWQEPAFLLCWGGIIVLAGTTYLPRPPGMVATLGLAAIAGLGIGSVIAAEGTPVDLIRSLPFVAISIPAAWIARRPARIAIKVLASWMIAVAVLAALLPITTTPGYQPDHME